MRTFLQDLRYGLRMLAKSPSFTAIALLTLTLGIGATAAIFSVIDAVLLKPLPYRDPARLVMVYEDFSSIGFTYNTPAPANYVDWKKQTQIFENVAALDSRVFNLTASNAEPEQLKGAGVTYDLFPLLGVQPIVGRSFLEEEDQKDGPHVAIIGNGLWRRRFGGDPAIVNRQIVLNNEKYTVVGIMPPGFAYPAMEDQIWTPAQYGAAVLAKRGRHFLNVTARLQPGVSVDKANAELKVLNQQLARQYPDTNSRIERFFVSPLQESYTRDSRRGLIVLFAAVTGILLIACANIANLLLSRASSRQREVAVRVAIGAARGRVIRQLLTESALLATIGGLFGVLLASWCFTFLRNLIPADLSQTIALTIDGRVLGFAILVTLTSSFLFGLAPALQTSQIDLAEVLKDGGRGNTAHRRGRFRNILVSGEIALSLMLMVGAGLLLQSFSNLRDVNPGFQSDHVLTMRLIFSPTKYGDFARRSDFLTQILNRVRTLPGVNSAGFTSALPLTWEGGTSGFTPDAAPLFPDLPYDANNRVVTPGYFETMRVALRRGRLFNASDAVNTLPVAMINEAMAKKYWPNQNPVGKTFQPGFGKETPHVTIIGVIGNVRQMRLNEPPREEMYFTYAQSKDNWMIPRDLVIRTKGDPLSLATTVRRAIWSIDRDQPISDIASLDQVLDKEVLQRRIQAFLLGALSALALTLACIGIYGVLSYAVAQRTQEIGVRVALGAGASDIFRNVARYGFSLAAIGVGIGVLGSLILTRLLSTLLFGIGATDPATYIAAIAVFAVVAAIACYIPARRATKVDAMVALRYE